MLRIVLVINENGLNDLVLPYSCKGIIPLVLSLDLDGLAERRMIAMLKGKNIYHCFCGEIR